MKRDAESDKREAIKNEQLAFEASKRENRIKTMSGKSGYNLDHACKCVSFLC